MTVNDKSAFEKKEPNRWSYKLWPEKQVSSDGEEVDVYLAYR